MIIKNLIILCLIFSCIACKDSKNEKKELKINNGINTPIIDIQTFEQIGEDKNLRYYLPNTIFLKDTLRGHLIYKSSFDTIQTDSSSLRIVDLYLAKTNSFSNTFDEFKQKKLDTFTRILDTLIPIFDIKFDKKGYNCLEGYIIDDLYLSEGENVRKKTINNHFMYRVLVK